LFDPFRKHGKIASAVKNEVERAAIAEAQPGRAPLKERCLPEKSIAHV